VPEIPASANVVGWYRQSARSGQVGNVVMVGRPSPDSEPAVFEHLGDLATGSSIDLIDEANGRYRYVVHWVRQVDRSSVDLAEIMGSTTQRWITLISWKGGNASAPSDRQAWTIVRATLAGPEP
jgi:sortase (surface protein transpeptidase)